MPDRPAHDEDEIEVTPEMIEAGIEAMWRHDVYEFNRDDWRDAVREAFRVMASLRS